MKFIQRTVLLLSIFISTSALAQNRIWLDNDSLLKGSIKQNSDEYILFQNDDQSLVIISRDRISKVHYEGLSGQAFNLVALDQQLPQQTWRGPGDLLTSGANNMMMGIGFALGSAVLSGLLFSQSDEVLPPAIVGGLGVVGGLGFTFAGLSKISKAGQLIDASRIEMPNRK